jgi:hypothetical protein
MEVRDRFDLPITSASAEAVEGYVAAIDLLLSANTGAEQRLARAVANDPDFALAHEMRMFAIAVPTAYIQNIHMRMATTWQFRF